MFPLPWLRPSLAFHFTYESARRVRPIHPSRPQVREEPFTADHLLNIGQEAVAMVMYGYVRTMCRLSKYTTDCTMSYM